jgi:hypothetical protein
MAFYVILVAIISNQNCHNFQLTKKKKITLCQITRSKQLFVALHSYYINSVTFLSIVHIFYVTFNNEYRIYLESGDIFEKLGHTSVI